MSEDHVIKVKVKYQGYISQKLAVLGALVFHKHILFTKGFFFRFYSVAKEKLFTDLCLTTIELRIFIRTKQF